MDKAKAVQDEDGKEMFEAGSEGAYYAGKFNAAAAKGDRAGMDAAIKAMRNSNMKDKDIAKVIRSAQNKGLLKNLGDGEAAWKRQLYKDYGGSFLATDYELSHFMRTGGAGNKGRLGAYGEYAKNAPITPDDMRKEDLLKLSGSSLAGMAAAGKVSQGMAKQVMAMHPNLSEDKLVMFGALADGMVGKSDFQDASGNIDDKKVAEFKNNAETIIGDPYQKSGKISGLLQNIGGDQIEKWTKPVADRVTIDQQEWNEVPVHVESNGQMVPIAKNDDKSLERMYPDIKEEDRATELTISHIDRRDAGTSEPGSGIILGSTGEENRRAMREFDQQQRNNRNWPGNR